MSLEKLNSAFNLLGEVEQKQALVNLLRCSRADAVEEAERQRSAETSPIATDFIALAALRRHQRYSQVA